MPVEDELDIYGDDFDYETTDQDNLMAEYGDGPEAAPEPPQQISSHTSQVQPVIGQKRAREDDNESDPKPQPLRQTGPGLPPKPEDVRSYSCIPSLSPPRIVVLALSVYYSMLRGGDSCCPIIPWSRNVLLSYSLALVF